MPLAAALAGAAGSFLLTSLLMDAVPDAGLVATSLAVAFVLTAALGGVPRPSVLRAAGAPALAMAAAGGALAFWAAPLLALAVRATDSPSAAETLYFTTCVWGAAAVVAAIAVRAERPSPAALAGVLGVLAGAAGLLASWERPSSFSPFSRAAGAELAMVGAGVLFALGALALAAACRRMRAHNAALVAVGAAAAVSLMAALPSAPATLDGLRSSWIPLAYLGAFVAAFAAGWVRLQAERGVASASVALLPMPFVVTGLALVERSTSLYGVSPVDWPGAFAGIAVIAAGCWAVWAGGPSEGTTTAPGSSVPIALAAIAAALALASLATPALSAVAEGHIGDTFLVRWTMVGAEAASGWLAVAAAGFAVATVFEAQRGPRARGRTLACVAGTVVSAVASVPLLSTTLHTWNGWVPANVQQAYGTEYARFAVQGILDPIRIAAVTLAVAATVVAVTAPTHRAVAEAPRRESAA